MEVWILRIIHITAGVFWAGYAIFAGWLLVPAIREAGPSGGAVMQALVKRKLPQMITMFGLINILAGLRLYMIYAGAEWIKTGTGILITIGAVDAIFSFIYGVAVTRPVALRMGQLGNEIRAAGGPPKPEQAAEMQKLSDTLGRAATLNAVMLGSAALFMAASRYAPF